VSEWGNAETATEASAIELAVDEAEVRVVPRVLLSGSGPFKRRSSFLSTARGGGVIEILCCDTAGTSSTDYDGRGDTGMTSIRWGVDNSRRRTRSRVRSIRSHLRATVTDSQWIRWRAQGSVVGVRGNVGDERGNVRAGVALYHTKRYRRR